MTSIFEDMVSDYHSSQETSKSRIPLMGEVETPCGWRQVNFLFCVEMLSVIVYFMKKHL